MGCPGGSYEVWRGPIPRGKHEEAPDGGNIRPRLSFTAFATGRESNPQRSTRCCLSSASPRYARP